MIREPVIYNGYYTIITQKDNLFIGKAENITDASIFFSGETLEEAKKNFRKCIDTYEITKNPKQQEMGTQTVITNTCSYISNIDGISKLVRRHGEIFIARRRGKSNEVYNRITESQIPISRATAEEFFADCKYLYGADTCKFKIDKTNKNIYDKWDTFMLSEYKEAQKDGR